MTPLVLALLPLSAALLLPPVPFAQRFPLSVSRRTTTPHAFVGPDDEDHETEEKLAAFIASSDDHHQNEELATAAPSTPEAFVGVHGGQASSTFTKTVNGLRYKDLVIGEGEEVASDSIVVVRFSASLVSSSESFDKASIIFSRAHRGVDLFNEAIDGMKLGGSRRVLLPPSALFAMPGSDETVEFEFELIEIKSGVEAALFKAAPAVGGLVRLAFFYVVTQTIFDLLGFSSGGVDAASLSQVAPNVDAANVWAAHGLQAVGLLDVTPTIDAANAWAAHGLQSVGL